MDEEGNQRRKLLKSVTAWSLLAITRTGVGKPDGGTASGPKWSKETFQQVTQLVAALAHAGEPLPAADSARILQLAADGNDAGIAELTGILDRYTVFRVELDAHGVGATSAGRCDFLLRELGWRTFLVRVENPAGVVGPLALSGRKALPEGELQASIHDSHILGNDRPTLVKVSPDANFDLGRESSQWLGFQFGLKPLAGSGLRGAGIEYQLLQLYSQQRGENSISTYIGLAALSGTRRTTGRQITQTFKCAPASTVVFAIKDTDGGGVTASLLISDQAGRIYPAPGHRIEPDLGYQWHIYRSDGEVIRLPAGTYRVVCARGPEYLKVDRDLVVLSDGSVTTAEFRLQRWIDPPHLGWYPGEPHIHAEGQDFGNVSKLGLMPETILRQVRGEALAIGSVLIWTGGYYFQKQFLTGHVYEPTYRLPYPEVQQANNSSFQPVIAAHDLEASLRYDVEQAAFPSNRFGHPILLRIHNHDFPGASGVFDWPSWNLPVLRWAREQGAVCGYAHCGMNMFADSNELPNYELPALDGLGANECLVDVTHGVVDFMAGGESPPSVDLNVWYHVLNCGFVIPFIGETDFPVGSLTRLVGTVRTYVGLKHDPTGDAGYQAWTDGLRAGRLYFGDGRSHLIDLQVNGHAVGTGPVHLHKAASVKLAVRVAALLATTPVDPDAGPHAVGFAHWHIERARLGTTRKVPLEVIVNGRVVRRLEIPAHGELQDVSLDVQVEQSSWIAVRILPTVHSAPIAVLIGDQPIRASRRSAQWCLQCIDVLWDRASWRIRDEERMRASEAWDHARRTYRAIAQQCVSD